MAKADKKVANLTNADLRHRGARCFACAHCSMSFHCGQMLWRRRRPALSRRAHRVARGAAWRPMHPDTMQAGQLVAKNFGSHPIHSSAEAFRRRDGVRYPGWQCRRATNVGVWFQCPSRQQFAPSSTQGGSRASPLRGYRLAATTWPI